MFSKTITSSDQFTEMSSDAQSLYFQLGMNADDDGFVTPKGIMRLISAPEDALRLLMAKGFVIPFETGNGVIVIRHWKENNELKKDRYTPTIYTHQKAELLEDENQHYYHRDQYDPNPEPTLAIKEPWNQNVSKLETQVRIGKVRIGKKESVADGTFDAFWKEYPNKKAKGLAERSWRKITPDEKLFADIMNALKKHKAMEQWMKEGGRFIPYPATWLNQRRWEDEVELKALSAPIVIT